MVKVYGINNCDTVKKTRRWLDDNGVKYEFVDFRKARISKKEIARWADTTGWEMLLNRRSTTWRKLENEEKESINKDVAIGLMIAHPTLIKRPVVTTGKDMLVGFTEKAFRDTLKG